MGYTACDGLISPFLLIRMPLRACGIQSKRCPCFSISSHPGYAEFDCQSDGSMGAS